MVHGTQVCCRQHTGRRGQADLVMPFYAKRHADKKGRLRGHTEKLEKILRQEEQGKKVTASTSPKTYHKESTTSWLYNQKYLAHHPATKDGWHEEGHDGRG